MSALCLNAVSGFLPPTPRRARCNLPVGFSSMFDQFFLNSSPPLTEGLITSCSTSLVPYALNGENQQWSHAWHVFNFCGIFCSLQWIGAFMAQM